MKCELLNVMGDDLSVVNSARVSFNKTSNELSEQDERLIKFLAKNAHFTPFTHCSISLRETVPIFVARQRFKHTVGFSYNEVSRRYVDDDPDFYTPEAWRERAPNLKQGSLETTHSLNKFISDAYKSHCDASETLYKKLLAINVAPEQARMVLPQSMYTSYWVTGSLFAFARAYNLRKDKHAQFEIRELAKEWDRLIRPLFPVSWKELCDN